MSEWKLNLKRKPDDSGYEPDGSGYIYGDAIKGDVYLNVNILPPYEERLKQPYYLQVEDDEKNEDWILYIDGEEAARFNTIDGLEENVLPKLLEQRSDKILE